MFGSKKLKQEIEQLNARIETLETDQVKMQASAQDSFDKARDSDQALKRNKEQLEAILNSTADSIFQVDKNGIILAINNIAARRVHHQTDDMIGKNAYDFFPPEVSISRRKSIEEVFSTGIEKHSEDTRNDHYFSLSYYPIHTQEKNVESVVVYAAEITQQKKESNILRESEEKLRGLYELSPLGIALTDMTGRYIEFNNSFERICGYSKDELNKLDYWTLTPKKYAPDETRQLELLNSTGRYGPYEKEYIRKDGKLIPILLNGLLITDNNGDKHIWSIVEDISERKQIMAELRDSEDRFRQMFERHSDVMLLIEPMSGTIVDANPAASEFYGYPLSYFIGKQIQNISIDLYSENQDKLGLVQDNESDHFVSQHKLANGDIRTVEVHSSPVSFKNRTLIFSIVHDITDRKLAEEEIRQLAFYDSLTNVPNRRLLNDRLAQAIVASKRNRCFGALMFLDLDNFKPINDTHGHKIGDLLLIEATRRITACIRATDTVARFGGDEFVVLLGELSDDQNESEAQAKVIAEKIRTAISELFRITVQQTDKPEYCVEHHCTTSIGVVLFSHQDSRDEVLKLADMAMYEAKGAGRNCVVFEVNKTDNIKN
jgi:diguanylate cyclase (GGDEF)-like protein/PAS domain S-box-containing protein